MAFIDPNIARKNAIMDSHLQASEKLPDGSPIFSELEFNITGLCNRTCVFCPRVDPEVFPNLNEHMSPDLYRKIMVDLKSIDYVGRVAYSGFGEPLLHSDVTELLRISREILPSCYLEIVTNGDRLSPKVLTGLFEAGLTTLLISMYDGPEQIEFFENLIQETPVPRESVILRPRYLPPEEGYGINLTNRGGTVTVKEAGVSIPIAPFKHQCFYTHCRMMVDYTGEVLLCPHDWGKKLIVGNLTGENIIDVWTGAVLTSVRKRLGDADRAFAPCNRCDVLGTRQGAEHFKEWQKLYQGDAVIP